jgi:uncharacterized membrane protein
MAGNSSNSSTGGAPAVHMSTRLGFLDWTRGLAAVIMLQGHVFHSFTSPDLREGSPYILSQFVGGMPPTIFLFLVGVTFAFLMDSMERKGMALKDRLTGALKRAGLLFALAFLFRLQMWVFGLPRSPASDLFKVDILNCMGLALGVMAVMTVFQTVERIRLCAILGLAIAAASPLVSALDWTRAHPLVAAYLAPDQLSFSFFPWAAFVAFGMSAGSILRVMNRDHMERFVQWGTLFGLVLIVGVRYFSSLPYSLYSQSDFWLDSPALVLIKLGIILLMISFAWLWNEYVVADRWSWVRQLGTTSLLVYWLHTELVYGRWFWFFKDSLSVAQTAVLAVLVIVLMVALSWIKTNWDQFQDYLPAPTRRLAFSRVTVRLLRRD